MFSMMCDKQDYTLEKVSKLLLPIEKISCCKWTFQKTPINIV